MSILDRSSLEQSTLADLHAIASELSIDSFRRLRKAQLIDAIIARQTGAGASEGEEEIVVTEEALGEELPAGEEERTSPRRRGRRGGRGRGGRGRGAEGMAEELAGAQEPDDAEADGDGDSVEGVVEILPGGSGFVRVNPPDPSNDDVYVSATQVRRCELVSGDRIAGRLRPPRRSERFAALVRVESINGRPASELADAPRFENLPALFPSRRLELRSEDPTLAAIDSLAPIGRGSRVTIAGEALTGKTEMLRRLASVLGAVDDLHVSVILAGVRPEEVLDWEQGLVSVAAGFAIGAAPDAVDQAMESAAEQARRQVVRGGHVVLLVDTLDGAGTRAARRLQSSARSIDDERSLTVIATSSRPLGGETTVVSLDPQLAGAGNFPAIDVQRTWTIHADRLVGAEPAQKMARVRAAAFRR